MTRSFVTLLFAVLLSTGCQTLGTQQRNAAATDTRLEEARNLIKSRQYADALSVLEKAVQQDKNSAAAPEIKYLIAMVYVAADNPQKDYGLALTEFDEFLHLYPGNDRAVEAKSWKLVIKTYLDTRKENEKLHRDIEGLKELDVRQEKKRLGK